MATPSGAEAVTPATQLRSSWAVTAGVAAACAALVFVFSRNVALMVAVALGSVAVMRLMDQRGPLTTGVGDVPHARQRVVKWTGAFVLAAILALIFAAWHDAKTSVAKGSNTTVAGATAQPPGAFAEQCVTSWLQASSAAAVNDFITACNPNMTPDELAGQQVADVQVGKVTAYGAPLSVVDPAHPGYWSVLVGAAMYRPNYEKQGGQTVRNGWASLGMSYFRAVVHTNADGQFALYGLPRPAPAPLDVAAPATAGPSLATPDSNDPRAEVIRNYLQRYLPAPPESNPAAGDVDNYLVPSSTPPVVVHNPAITKVDLLAVGFADDPADQPGPDGAPTLVAATAKFRVTYVGGAALIQQMHFTLARRGQAQWLIQDTPVVPASEEAP